MPTPAPTSEPQLTGSSTRIVVLGSQGGQQITQLTGANVRAGSSIAIEVDGQVTVIDCGPGSLHRLAQAGYDANQVRHVLVTHCHADHVAELGSFATFAWSSGRNGVDRDRRLDVYGPTGLADYQRGMKASLRLSIEDQEGPLGQRPAFSEFAHWHELEPTDEVMAVFADDHLEVTAIRVAHGAMPALAFRIRTAQVDVVFSGDRGVTGDRFTEFARGADVLFHEVIHGSLVQAVLEGQGMAPTFVDHLVHDHTDAPDVGRIATEAGVPKLVLYHLIPGNPGITDDQWIDLVRPHFAGEILVAHDLQVL